MHKTQVGTFGETLPRFSRAEFLRLLAGGVLLAGCGGGGDNGGGDSTDTNATRYRYAYSFGLVNRNRGYIYPGSDGTVYVNAYDEVFRYTDFGRGNNGQPVHSFRHPDLLTRNDRIRVVASPVNGNIYLSANSHVIVCNPAGEVLYKIGGGGRDETTPFALMDMKMAQDGSVCLLTDNVAYGLGLNVAVLRFDTNGNRTALFAPSDEPHIEDEICALALTPQGTVYVFMPDIRGALGTFYLREYDWDGTRLSRFKSEQSSEAYPYPDDPRQVHTDRAGNIYFSPLYAVYNMVEVYKPDGTRITRFVPDFNIVAGLGQNAVDANGNLYLPGPDPETGEERILVYQPTKPLV